MKIIHYEIMIAILIIIVFILYNTSSRNGHPLSALSLNTKNGISIIDNRDESNTKLKFIPVSRERIIAWEWDCGGFNNIRMQFEIMFGLSIIYGRTLVLPPAKKWYLMPDDEPCDIQSFYQIDILRSVYSITTAEEWFGKPVSYQEYTDFFHKKNQFPETHRVNAIKSRWEKLNDIVQKEDLQSKETWFFQSCQENYRYRMFGNPDDYFRKSDKLDIIRDSCCRGFKFKQEITDILLNQLRQEDITQIGSYNAVHFRRGDFSDSHPHQVNVDMKVYRDVLTRSLDVDIPLLIITNEKDKTIFQPIKEVFHRVFYLDMSIVPKNQKKWIALLDSLGGVLARKFVGTAESTFSYYIQILRGYMAYYYPSLVSDKMIFLQEERSREVVKTSPEWECQQGCWAVNDQDHWRFLASQKPMPTRRLY